MRPQPRMVRAGGIVAIIMPPPWLRVIVPPRPMSGGEFLAAYPNVSAILDGSMFRVCRGEPHDYASYQCGVVEYAAMDAVLGTFMPPSYPDRGATLLVYPDGSTGVADGASPGRWGVPWLAWQGYPLLVRDGRVVASPYADSERTERAACGRLSTGEVAFISGVAPMHEFATAVRDVLGASDVMYSDGGQSRVMAMRWGDRVVADDPTNLTARRVPSFLCAVDPELWRLGP